MSDDMPTTTNHADESMKAEGAGVNLNIRVVPTEPKERSAFVYSIGFSALALAVSIVCAFYAFEAGRQASLASYFMGRSETFLEQLANQGVKVPCDLRPHNKECKS